MTTPIRRHFTATVAALAVAAALTACSAPSDPAELTADPSSSADDVTAAGSHNDADAGFAQMMIVHHEGALQMAGLALERASDDRVRDQAEEIARAQGPEIELMSGWLETWGEDPSAAAGHGGMDHGAMEMDGMDQEHAMASLSELEGVEFDRRFLELMVAHHRGAIEMAETQRSDGLSSEARGLAETIIGDQAAEIALMEDLLRDL